MNNMSNRRESLWNHIDFRNNPKLAEEHRNLAMDEGFCQTYKLILFRFVISFCFVRTCGRSRNERKLLSTNMMQLFLYQVVEKLIHRLMFWLNLVLINDEKCVEKKQGLRFISR